MLVFTAHNAYAHVKHKKLTVHSAAQQNKNQMQMQICYAYCFLLRLENLKNPTEKKEKLTPSSLHWTDGGGGQSTDDNDDLFVNRDATLDEKKLFPSENRK